MNQPRQSITCSNLKCPTNGKQFRLTMRTSNSGYFNRAAPEFFKDSRIRTCSSIKLVDGVPKAISFPVSRHRAQSERRQRDHIKKGMVTNSSSIYQ